VYNAFVWDKTLFFTQKPVVLHIAMVERIFVEGKKRRKKEKKGVI